MKGVSVLSEERLTVADEDLGNGMKRCHIIDGNEVRKHAMDFYWRLKEYEDLEEQGLLLRLPVAVGDTVYQPNFIADKVHEIKITAINLYESEIGINGLLDNREMFYCGPEHLGEIVFLTQSEAEEKLRELEGK